MNRFPYHVVYLDTPDALRVLAIALTGGSRLLEEPSGVDGESLHWSAQPPRAEPRRAAFAAPPAPARCWAARHFMPSFLPAASRRMASCSRLVFVSCRMAESIQPMYMRRYDGARPWK